MAKFNFLAHRNKPSEIPDKDTSVVRTRAYGKDRYEGLRGHAYINARNAERNESDVQTSARIAKRD